MLKGEALWADHPKATNMAPWHPGASVCEFGGNLGQGDLGSIPGSGRSLGEGNGNLLQYSCLEKTEKPSRLQSMGSQRVRHD